MVTAHGRLRRLFVILTAVLFGTIWLVAACGRLHATVAASKCTSAEAPEISGWQPIPKGAKIDCLREIASHQVPATVIQQNYIPSMEPGCETSAQYPNTTQIIVTAYQGVDKLAYANYKSREGYVVARVDNPSNCNTKHLKLQPGHSYYFVVEGYGTKARLVDLITGPDIQLGKFISCTDDTPNAPPSPAETPLNVAFLRTQVDRCNHNPVPEGQMKALFSNQVDAYLADSARTRSAMLTITDPWVVWISCGTDCCFADL